MRRSPRLVIAGLVLPMCFACGAQARAQSPTTWPSNWGQFIVLGRVEHEQGEKHGGNSEDFDYNVHVICEYRDRIKAGSEITILGTRSIAGEWLVRIPVMAKGTYFVLLVSSTAHQGVYQYKADHKIWLPIGIKSAAAVAKEDVPGLKAALLKYGRLSARKMPNVPPQGLTPKQAAYASFVTYFNNRKYYYLWALAADEIAENATHQDVTLFQTHLQLGQDAISAAVAIPNPEIVDAIGVPVYKNILPPRRAFWLVHLLTEVVPKDVRPPCDEVERELIHYMDRWVNSAEPRNYVSWPFE